MTGSRIVLDAKESKYEANIDTINNDDRDEASTLDAVKGVGIEAR